jgi:hypothetical protein
MRASHTLRRLPLMAVAMLALLSGIWTGLLRLGWELPPLRIGLAAHHGPLMLSGFLGTLIALERAVALGRRWPYGAPLLSGAGALALLLGLPDVAGRAAMTAGSAVLLAACMHLLRRQSSLPLAVMALGAGAWLTGHALWLAGWPLFLAVPWWIGFLTFTIAGERLELSRLLQPSAASRMAFVAAVGLYLAGALLSGLDFPAGAHLSGTSLVLLAGWLLRHDLARRTVRQPGLPRFIAVCLLSGYAWLAAGGALGLRFGPLAAGPAYDAMLHALFLGFGFSMIFGHAPVIFPAVLCLPVPFRPRFYAHLAVLHLSLLLRAVGDLAGWWPARQWGGLINGLALLLFLANTADAAITAPALRRVPTAR